MLDNPATIAATAGEVVFLGTAIGMVASGLWVLPHTSDSDTDLKATRHKLWKALGLALLLFTLADCLELWLRTASISDLPLSEASSQIGTVLQKTHYGQLWLWRMVALLITAAAWVLYWRPALSNIASIATFITLTVITGTFSTAGHAGDDGVFTLINLANSLHILGAFLWGGGIIATAFITLPALLRAKSINREIIAAASLRLSTLAGIALVLVIIPGFYNAWLQIGSWHGLWFSLYGQLLVAKVLLVAIMIGLGSLNRYRYVPAIQRYADLPEPRVLIPVPRFIRRCDDQQAVKGFLRSLKMEMALALSVLILAAALSQQVPAAHAEHEDMHEHHHDDHGD